MLRPVARRSATRSGSRFDTKMGPAASPRMRNAWGGRGRGGLGHRLAAEWAWERAAFGDG